MTTTTRMFRPQAPKQVARMTIVALAGITYFVVIILALHFIRPDVSPFRQPTSEYAVGPYGFLMTSAFLSMSLASWALVIGLYQGVPQPARSQIGLSLLGVWALGVLIAMIFPIDLAGAPQTMSGTIHRINGPLTFFSLTAGVLMVSRRFKYDEMWRPFHRLALILSLVMLVEFIAILVAIVTQSGLAGLGQRFYLATFATWFWLTASRLRALASESM